MRSTYVRTYVLSAGEGEHMEWDEGEEMDGRGALRAGFCAVGLRARLLGTKALLARTTCESCVAGGAPGFLGGRGGVLASSWKGVRGAGWLPSPLPSWGGLLASSWKGDGGGGREGS